MNGLAIFERDEVNLKRMLFFGKREDKGLLPDEILLKGRYLAISFVVVIGQAAVHRLLPVHFFELRFPEGYD